MKVISTSSRGP